MRRKIDHIVYSVPDLEEAIDSLEKKLGVRPKIGGKHQDFGTKNALVNLGDQCYLEILAIDSENASINEHWMGLDMLTSPKVTRWSVKADAIEKDANELKKYKSELGHIIEGRREISNGGTLTWKMTRPQAQPEVEIVPFVTDWSDSDSHPTDTMEEVCKFMCIELYHTDPKKIKSVLQMFREDVDIKKGDRDAIYLYIESPKGIVKL